MALIHELLYRSGDLSNIDLQRYIRGLVDSLLDMYGSAAAKVEFEVIANDVALGIDDTVPCGLIINELISNSLKHAFVDGHDARIRIEAKSSSDGEVSLVVCDNGVGLPTDLEIRDTETMGLRLVVGLAENQLGGSLEVDRHHGTRFTIIFSRNQPIAGAEA
jgi:two-component sensor histidine kinase